MEKKLNYNANSTKRLTPRSQQQQWYKIHNKNAKTIGSKQHSNNTNATTNDTKHLNNNNNNNGTKHITNNTNGTNATTTPMLQTP